MARKGFFMRDLQQLRYRLLAAMGLVGATLTGCGQDSTGTTGAADAAPSSDTGTAVESDTAGQDGAMADVAADATNDDISATTDATNDDIGASDAAIDILNEDSQLEDTAVTDTQVSDTQVPDTGSGDAGVDGLSTAVCSNGQGQVVCMTAAQLAYAVDNKGGGGAPFDAGDSDADGSSAPPLDYPVPPEGCPTKERVFDGCCNAASDGPVLVGETCCYVFCQGACCGRPLLIEGRAAQAEVRGVDGWASLGHAEADIRGVEGLDAVTRAALADAWAADAVMEHASIASFHRFGLDLLRLGAPAGLVADAARAVLDEVDHAERCFAIASMLADAPRGPGPLDLPTALPLSRDLAEAVALTVHEGCVGETLAASLAQSAARNATAPLVRSTLEIIAADEARHAELAWRFVRWALQYDDSLRAVAGAAFNAALCQLPEPVQPRDVDAKAFRAYGRLDATSHRAAVLACRREVLWPCAVALCGEEWVDVDDRAAAAATGAAATCWA